jgi:PadR family transcriptional regulator PadR
VTTADALNKKFQKEINAGVTGLVLLSVLAQGKEPMYGYQIAKLLSAESSNEPPLKQGALYPVLRSMEKSKLLDSQIEPSASGPPRRYYSITKMGRETLQSWTEMWGQTKSFVDTILEGASNE